MAKITNIQELTAEINRLKIQSKMQQQQIRTDLLQIKEDLKPVNILWSLLSSITGMDLNRNNFFQKGISGTISTIVRQYILKAEEKIEAKIYDWVDSLIERFKNISNPEEGTEVGGEER